MKTDKERPDELQRSLKNRHIQMIALGGAIGTGLFYGSGTTIKLVGPGISLSYIIGGIAIFFIMRALGEMSVDEPVSGSFSHYAYRYWGDFAGFFSGWNYWFCYVVVSMAELSAVGVYINYWFPTVPTWLSALVFLIIITLVNLINVKAFGELEFWFSLIKVVAIIAMILFGLLIIFFGLGNNGQPIGLSNLWAHGGYLPNGLWGLLLSLVIVMFSFGGVELIGITAGEADNPTKTIPKAINQVVWRILLFYVGALLVLTIIYPWNLVGTTGSPFVEIFSKIGIPAAAGILNVVVLTAALSTYNSGLYSNGRMLHSLALHGSAPKIFARLSKAGTPVTGILFSSAFTLIAVVLNFLVPGKVFLYIISVATIAAIFNWIMIIITHLKFRRRKQEIGEAGTLTFKLPLYPVSNYVTLAFLVMVIALMAYIPDMAYSLYIGPIWLLIIFIGYKLRGTS
ncbi:Aromatic amino acid transport protein AroP [Desulfosporosinus metallidurans]|uniref:Aromatic amino acid transport protein AroP n=2 Tax=Desulfosporosinus metallidurans TaxID=1888891 RepID=A0A1Q8QXH8_9FIRM|nr:amino acid permease [Desulfosporosinus metallidurans]OLN32052.1 Aromatic amino acid transport protein AroP [Desulfosporosinus metallidurans]